MRSKFWAYPPGIPESGVGWFETAMGLMVFLILGVIAAQGFRQASSGQEGYGCNAFRAPARPPAVWLSAMAVPAKGAGLGQVKGMGDGMGDDKAAEGGRE